MAAKGITPTRSVPSRVSQVSTDRCVPWSRKAVTVRAISTRAENIIAITVLAVKYAIDGMGETRFSIIQPWPRSAATPAPKANRAALMTPTVA